MTTPEVLLAIYRRVGHCRLIDTATAAAKANEGSSKLVLPPKILPQGHEQEVTPLCALVGPIQYGSTPNIRQSRNLCIEKR